MAEFDKLTEYGDEALLRKNTDFILSLIDEVVTKGANAGKLLQESFTLFDGKDPGAKKMADEYNNLSLTAANYQKVLAAVALEVDNLTQQQKDQLKVINDEFKIQEQARQGAKQTVDLIKTEIAQTEKLDAQKSALAATIAQNNVQIKKQNDLNKANAEIMATEEGSIKRAEAVRKRLLLIQKEINVTTDQGAQKSENYKKKINELNDFIKANSDKLTAQKINIGNYQGSAKIIVDALDLQKKKLEELIKAREKLVNVQNAGSTFKPGGSTPPPIIGFAGGNSGQLKTVGNDAAATSKQIEVLNKEIAQTTTVVEGFTRVTEQKSFLKLGGEAVDASMEFKTLQRALIDLEANGLGHTEGAKKLKIELGELKDKIGDVKEEIKALSSDTRGFDLFAGSVTLAADAAQTAAGAYALLGGSEEDVAKITKNLVAVQAVANGIKGIANELTTKGTAANKIYAFFQTTVAAATNTASTATARLNAVLKLSTIGVFIALLAAAYYAYQEFNKASEVAAKDTEDFKNKLDENTKALERNLSAIDKSIERRKILNKQKVSGDALKEVDAESDMLALTEKRAAVQKEIKNITGQQKKLLDERIALEEKSKKINDQTIILDPAKSALKALLLKQADAKLGSINEKLKASNEKYIGLLDQETELGRLQTNARLNQIGDVAQAKFKADDEAKKKATEEAKRTAEQQLKDALDAEKRKQAAINALVKENIAERIRLNQLVIDNDKSSLGEKLQAQQLINDDTKKLYALEYHEAVASETKIENGKRVVVKKTAEEILLAKTQLANKSLAIDQSTAAASTQMIKDTAEKNKQLFADLQTHLNAAADRGGSNQESINAIRKNNELQDLNDRFNAGKIKNVEDYEKKKAAIEKKYELEDLQAQLDVEEEKLQIAILFGEDTLAIERKISDLTLALQDKEVDKAKDTAAKKLAIEQELAAKKAALVDGAKQLLLNIVDGQFERQKNQIATLIQLNEDQKNAEIDRITKSTAAETDKAAQIAVVNARAQAKKEALDKRQKQLDHDKAVFDRIVTIGEIIANTAKAVTKDLILNKAAIPLDIAIGALQLAAVLAKPIPKFAEGLDEDFEGWAWLGDGGRREAHIKKGGQVNITPATDTLTWIDKGDRVHPDADAFLQQMQYGALVNAGNMAAQGHQVADFGTLLVKGMEQQLMKNADKIVAAINSKETLQINAKRGAVEAIWQHAANTNNYLQDNTNWNA